MITRWRHKRRGTEYQEIGRGLACCSKGPIKDDDRVVIYRGDDGKLWVRNEAEFEDGRFMFLPTPYVNP
jgi:hypothetical protein